MSDPFSTLHLEKGLLACVMQNPDLLIELDGRLSIEAFRSPINQSILSSLIKLHQHGYTRFDKEMLYNQVFLYPIEGFTTTDMTLYINALFNAPIHTVNFDKYVQDLGDVYTRFKLYNLLIERINQVQTNTNRSSLDLIDSLNQDLMGLLNYSQAVDDPEDVCKGIFEHIQDKFTNPEGNFGVPTGLNILDDVMLGYLKTKFYFYAARPGRGKSAMLMQSSVHAAFFANINRVPVLYIDTEIGKKEFTDRTLAHLSSVDALHIMRASWTNDPTSVENINQAAALMDRNKDIYLHKYLPGFKTSQIISMIKKAVYNKGVGLVMFDYIKEPHDSEDRARWQKIGDLARALKETAGQLEIPIVSALQQNRKGEGVSRVDGSALAESDDVLKECDMAFALNRKTDDEVNKETLQAGTHRLQLIKGRYTKSIYSGINLRYYGHCFRFMASPLQQIFNPMDNTHNAAPEQPKQNLNEGNIFAQIG